MTKEEAIANLKMISVAFVEPVTKEQGELIDDTFALAINALEQEPCADAISRQAVLDKLNRLIEVERLQGTDEMGYGRERVSAYECMIYSIQSEYLYPNIQPKPKTGHWIEDTNGTYTDNHDTWECSECGHAQILLEGTPKDNDYNYCPSCGAKMIEPQESEGKNDTQRKHKSNT